MNAIVAKYCVATKKHGPGYRVSAFVYDAEGPKTISAFVPYNGELSDAKNAALAAEKLARQMKMHGEWYQHTMPNGDDYVFTVSRYEDCRSCWHPTAEFEIDPQRDTTPDAKAPVARRK